MKDFLLVGIGGLFGSMARFGVSLIFLKYQVERLFLSTLTVNLLGCLLIGIFAGWLSKTNHPLVLLATVGFCGGFTTFSSFALEGMRLLKMGMYTDLVLYVGFSMIGGVGLCFLGYYLSSKL